MCSILFANVVASFGINYIAQLIMFFFALSVFISVTASEVSRVTVQGVEEAKEEPFVSAGSMSWPEGLTQ